MHLAGIYRSLEKECQTRIGRKLNTRNWENEGIEMLCYNANL